VQQVLTELDNAPPDKPALAERLPLLLSRLFGDGASGGWELQLDRTKQSLSRRCAPAAAPAAHRPVVRLLEERSPPQRRFATAAGLTWHCPDRCAHPLPVIALIGLMPQLPSLTATPRLQPEEKQRSLG